MHQPRSATPKKSSDDLVRSIFRRIVSKLDHPVSLLALKDHRAQLTHKFDFDYVNCSNITKLKQLVHLSLREIELLANSKTMAESPVFNLYEEFAEHVNQKFIDLKSKNQELAVIAKAYKHQVKSFEFLANKIKEAAALKAQKIGQDFNCNLNSPKVHQGDRQ